MTVVSFGAMVTFDLPASAVAEAGVSRFVMGSSD
jgi:hypothetical protein